MGHTNKSKYVIAQHHEIFCLNARPDGMDLESQLLKRLSNRTLGPTLAGLQNKTETHCW